MQVFRRAEGQMGVDAVWNGVIKVIEESVVLSLNVWPLTGFCLAELLPLVTIALG